MSLHVRITPTVRADFDALSEQLGVPVDVLVEDALASYIKRRESAGDLTVAKYEKIVESLRKIQPSFDKAVLELPPAEQEPLRNIANALARLLDLIDEV